MKCKVCGKRFKLKKENKYIKIKYPAGLSVLIDNTVFYECFDCPKCGCQNIVNIREGEEDENKIT